MILFNKFSAQIYAFLIIATINTSCNESFERSIVYKKSNGVSLKMIELSHPQKKSRQCGIVFFHGGGFRKGNPNQFKAQANYLASKGAKCYLVQYRLQSDQGFNPIESLVDAKEAIQYLRRNAVELNLNPDRIVAVGASAGGYLALGSAVLDSYNDLLEDNLTSDKPNAIILLNPLINTGPNTYASKFFDDKFEFHSPYHNMKENTPPMLIMSGTEDRLIKIEEIKVYKESMNSLGNRIDLIPYQGEGHGFFNDPASDQFASTLNYSYQFLQSLEFLND